MLRHKRGADHTCAVAKEVANALRTDGVLRFFEGRRDMQH